MDDFEECLPSYIVGKTDEYMTIGAQLLTRDGRRAGNAVVFRIADTRFGRIAHIVTDIGTDLRLTENELKELFHTPKYTINIETHNGYIAMLLKTKAEGELF